MRILVVAIQFFLIAIRPFVSPKNSLFFFWGASFASTMLSLQLLLNLGCISENFGGYTDKSLIRMLSHANEHYLTYFNIETFESIY